MGGPRAAAEERTSADTDLGAAATADGAGPAPGPLPAARGERKTPGALSFPLALATLALAYWCVDIVSPALPAIQRSLGLSGTGAGLVFAAFFAGRLVTNLPAAFLVDRVGPRWTALVGSLLLLLGSVLAAVAGSEAVLLPARALQGTGIALLVTAGLLSLLRTRPAGGAAMTAFNVAAGVGGSAGLVVGGALTGTLGWRTIFWLSAVLGATLLAGAILARGAAAPAPTPRQQGDGEAGGVGPVPGRRALGGALLANLLVYGNYSVWVVSLSLYADDQFDASAGRIGTLLLVINAVHLLATVPAGRAIRRAGSTRTLAIGFGLTAAGLALVPAAPSAIWLLGPMTFYAIGQVMGNSAAGDLVLQHGGRGGRAVGLVRMTSDVGLVAGPAAVGALADAAGTVAPFPVLAALTALAAVAAWRNAARLRMA